MARFQLHIVSLLALILAACATDPVERAPTEERSLGSKAATSPAATSTTTTSVIPAGGETAGSVHVVQKGETLYRIATRYKIPVNDLAAWNNISDPNRVEADQRLRLTPPGSATGVTTQPVVSVAPVEARPLPPATSRVQETQLPLKSSNTANAKHEPLAGKQAYSDQAWAKIRNSAAAQPTPVPVKTQTAEISTEPKPEPKAAGAKPTAWAWPCEGKVVRTFDGKTSKGLDLAASPGDAVTASAAGKIIYAGPGLRGAGKLVVIKHPTQFLSVYEYSGQTLVKESQTVNQGQKLAELDRGEGSAKVRFEIRQNSKPVDPATLLPSRE